MKRTHLLDRTSDSKLMISALDAIRKIPPTEMFKAETDKYSKFDDKVSQHFLFFYSLTFLLSNFDRLSLTDPTTLKFVVFPNPQSAFFNRGSANFN